MLNQQVLQRVFLRGGQGVVLWKHQMTKLLNRDQRGKTPVRPLIVSIRSTIQITTILPFTEQVTADNNAHTSLTTNL
jgi:hypothetical protein